MKHICILLIAIAAAFLTGCNNGQKTNVATLNNAPDKKTNALYDFVQTRDKDFCNADSILRGDCDGGNIYLTAKGNAIFIGYCMGADTDKYDVGTYSVSESGITCTFSRTYAVQVDLMGNNSKEALNNGVMKGGRVKILELKKLNCGGFDFGFISPEHEYFTLRKPEKAQAESFMKEFKQIQLFSDL